MDDYVAANAPARFIDAYVEGLDFVALGFTHARPKDTGRPPYHPADLLKLYLYGYLHRVRSSRRLEAEAARNLEVVWLLRGLRPDFKTIADFRRDNRAAFQPLFKQSNLLCRSLDLFGAQAVAAKEELRVETLQAVADKGYHQADQIEACEQGGVETFVPEPDGTAGRGPGGREVYSKEQFRYDAAADAYHCPGGAVLPRASVNQDRGRERILYYHRAACRECPLRGQCTTARWRVIARRPNEAVVERAAARVAARPEIVAERKTIVEHVFGTLRAWGHDHFLMRGLAKVRAEFSLSAMIYNLRRMLNLRSVEELLAALRQPAAA